MTDKKEKPKNNKILKRKRLAVMIASGAVIFAILVFLGLNAAVLFINSGAGKKFIEESVNSGLNGHFSFDRIRLSFFDGSAKITDVRLDDPNNSPIARIKEIEAVVSWQDLLKGRILVTGAKVSKPEIVLFETITGQLNIMAAFKPAVPSGSSGNEPSGGGLPFNLVIKNAQIRDCLLIYADRSIRTVIKGLEADADYDLAMSTGNFGIRIPSAFLDVPGYKSYFMPLSLSASLEKGNVTSLALDGTTEAGRLFLGGAVKDLFSDPLFDLNLNVFASLEEIRKSCDLGFEMNGHAAAYARAFGHLGDPQGHVMIVGKNADILGKKISGVQAEAFIRNRQAVAKIKASDNGGTLDTSGYVDLASAFPSSFFSGRSDIEKMVWGISAKLENVGLKQFASSESGLSGGSVSGQMTGDFKGVSASLMSARITAGFSGKSISWKRQEMSKTADSLRIEADIRAKNGVVNVEKFGLDAAGSKVSTKGWFSIPSDEFSASTYVDSPDVENLFRLAGDIKAKGSISAIADFSGKVSRPVFSAKVKAENLAFEGISLGQLKLDASMNESGKLVINELGLKNGETTLTASGSAIIPADKAYDHDSPVSLKASLKNFNPALFWVGKPPFDGKISAELDAKGTASETIAVLKSEASNLLASGIRIGNASLRSEFSKGCLDIKDLTITNGGSAASMAGRIGIFSGKGFELEKNPLVSAEIRNADLSAGDFLSGMKGKITASGRVSGSLDNPSGGFEIKGDRISYDKFNISSASLVASLSNKRLNIEAFDINPSEKENIRITGFLKRDGALSLNLDTGGVSLSNFGEALSLPDITGTLSATLRAGGTLSKPEADGAVSLKGLGSNGHRLNDLAFSLKLENSIFRIDAAADTSSSASPFSLWANLERKDFGADADIQNAVLTPLFKAAGIDELEGSSSIFLKARGNMDKIDLITANAGIRNLNIRFRNHEFVNCKSLDTVFSGKILSISPSELKINKNGMLNVSGRWDLAKGLDIDTRAKLLLEEAAPALQDMLPDIEGGIKAEARISGDPAKPVIKGNLILENIAFTIPDSFQRVEKFSGKIGFTPEKMTIENFKGFLDDGTFSMAGDMTLDGLKPSSTNMRMRARSLPVRVPDAAELKWNIDLALKGGGDAPFLSGEAVLIEGTYYKDVDLSLISLPKRPERKKPPVWEDLKNPFLRNMGLGIDIKKREALLVDNNLANMEISPDLKISGKLSAPVVSGRCKVDSGTIYYRKNEYAVKKGVIDFINPYKIEPEFDIESTSTIKKWTVTLAITGTPEKLKFDLSSNPPLDDNDILSLVILGNVAKDVSGTQAAKRPASEMLAEMLASTFSDELKSVAGLDILEAGDKSGSDDDMTRVTIGKNLSKRLAIKYTVDSREGEISQKALAEYKLLENIVLNGFRDSNGIYGGELQYRLEFR